VVFEQVLKVALATNNAVVADGANITVAGLRVIVTPLNGYSAPHTGNQSIDQSINERTFNKGCRN